MTARTALFWIAAAGCVLAELAILRSVLFGRAAAAGRSDESPRALAPAKRRSEIAWALLPAAGLLLVLYLTWRAVDAYRAPAAPVSTGGMTIGA